MIEIEILSSNDPDRVGKYQIFHNEMTIGAQKDNFIYLPTDEVPKELFMMNIQENKLHLKLMQEDITFHLNGKITKISKQLKIGDIIKLNNFSFKITNYIEEKVITRKEFLNNKVEEIGKSDHDLLNLIQALGK